MLKTIIVMGVSGSANRSSAACWPRSSTASSRTVTTSIRPSNKAKMSAGTPLTDDDRWPWYAVLRQRIEDMRHTTSIYVLACSALKPIYRDKLRAHDADATLRFVLLEGTHEFIASRLAARKGHFMPPALLDSQLATLETDARRDPRLD
jgi:gluconokinase